MVGLPLCLVQLPLGPTLHTPHHHAISMTMTITTLKMLMMVTMGNESEIGAMIETVNMGMTAIIAKKGDKRCMLVHHAYMDFSGESVMKRPGKANWHQCLLQLKCCCSSKT